MNKKIIRTATIGLSLNVFCKNLFNELAEEGYDVIALSSPDNDLREVGDREVVRTIGVKMCRKITPLRDVFSLIRLITIFWKERPDMVHSITPKAGLLSMLAAKITRVPVRVHTFTGLLFPTARGIKRKILKVTDRFTCKCATHVIAEGNGVKSDLLENGITRKEVRILGYGNLRGVDMLYYDRLPGIIDEASEIRNKLTDNKDKNLDTGSYPKPFVFVFVGRFSADKGLDNLIEAFSKLIGEKMDVKLIMAGDFDPEDPLKPATIEFIKNSKDIFTTKGWVKDIRPYLAAADALVFPSRREGFPNVVLEAGAMGLPSIVTDINGSREIITNNLNGMIIPPDDLPALIETMRCFADNRDLAVRLSENARKTIADRYEQSFVRANLKRYYKEVLHKDDCEGRTM